MESKPGLVESKLESHNAGIGIRIGIKLFLWKHENRNHFLLDSELESESWILVNPGIGISPSGIKVGIGIMKIVILESDRYEIHITISCMC